MKQIVIPNTLPFLTKANLRLYFPKCTSATFDEHIKNNLARGTLLALKKGLYISSKYGEGISDRPPYWEFLANVIYAPSYLSREYVLQRHGMLTESVFAFTSVTLKTSRTFSNSLGIFDYRSIKPDLYSGFEVLATGTYRICMATKAKALFDYLYFYKRKLERVTENAINELRINLDPMNQSDWEMFETYLATAKSRKMESFYRFLKKSTC